MHPGVWWIAMRLRAERELACDDRVLSAGENAREYAGHLLELAYTLGHSAAPRVVVTMARPRELEGRMLAVLDAARNRRDPRACETGSPGAAILVALTGARRGGDDHAAVHVLDAEEILRATRGRFARTRRPPPRRLAFEWSSINALTRRHAARRATSAPGPGGILTPGTIPVSNFITNAYGRSVLHRHRRSGVDARSIGTDLEARADGEPSRAEMMLMLRTLLAERFQFRMHRETRELPAYVLTVARGVRSSRERRMTIASRAISTGRRPRQPRSRLVRRGGRAAATTTCHRAARRPRT
jgi:hypothetical protein